MRLTYISTCLFVSVALSLAQSTDATITDVTYSGLYKIVNCHANWPSRLNPEALRLRNFLGEAWNSTKLVLTDITNGTNSKYGFNALFKTNDSVTTVTNTIWAIRNGGGVGLHGTVPTMVCLDDDSTDPLFQILYNQTCTPRTVAAAIPAFSYLGLCPSFFEITRKGLDFPIPLDCPKVDSTTNTIQGSLHPLVSTLRLHPPTIVFS